MNKIKYAFLSLLMAVGFSACNQNDYEYTPAPPVTAGTQQVGFAKVEDVTMGVEQKELEIEVTRTDTKGDLTVALRAVDVPSCFTLPSSVTFKDGEATAKVVVKVDDTMKAFTKYTLMFQVDEAYTQPYNPNAMSPLYKASLIKEDYEVVAVGEFQEPVLFGDKWEQAIEYSASQKLFRLSNLIEKGYHFYFKFTDGLNIAVTDKDGKEGTKFETGYVHSKYGMISWSLQKAFMGYVVDEEDDNAGYFEFPVSYVVSAGSFGTGADYLIVNKWDKRPFDLPKK